MKKLLFAAVVAVMFASCANVEQKSVTTISGRFVGSNVDSVYLERVSDTFATPERMAGVSLADNGGFKFEFEVEEDLSPRFYKLTFPGGVRPIMLVVSPGDDIRLESAGDIFLNYTVEGSEESALIREFNRDYFAAGDRLARIAESLVHRSGAMSEMERQAYNAACEAIQAQVRFVGTYQDRLAAFYALRHNVAEQYVPQLNGYGITLAHYTSVLDGLQRRYPDSPYIDILKKEMDEALAIAELTERVEVVGYPDIELEDIYKKKHRLSSLDGKVVMLYFWSAEIAMCNQINAELKAIYEKYHERGFEVYHVSADSDISVWIEAVRQQRHPWVSVYGGATPELFSLYNIGSLPAVFLIDREGNIESCDFAFSDLEKHIEKLL